MIVILTLMAYTEAIKHDLYFTEDGFMVNSSFGNVYIIPTIYKNDVYMTQNRWIFNREGYPDHTIDDLSMFVRYRVEQNGIHATRKQEHVILLLTGKSNLSVTTDTKTYTKESNDYWSIDYGGGINGVYRQPLIFYFNNNAAGDWYISDSLTDFYKKDYSRILDICSNADRNLEIKTNLISVL